MALYVEFVFVSVYEVEPLLHVGQPESPFFLVAVVFVGEDLDVLIELCDRILVIGSGKVTGVVDGRTADKSQIGLLMTKAEGGAENV